MKRREITLAVVGALLLATGWVLTRRSTEFPTEEGTLQTAGCRVPYTHFKPGPNSEGRTAVVFHGLSANRVIMKIFGLSIRDSALPSVFLVDLPGHGDNSEHFSFARAEQCAAEVVETLEKRGDLQLDKTVLMGHSMGGAIAIRMADRFPAAATVAVSPAPMVRVPGMRGVTLPYTPPHRMPVNLLILTGAWEPSFAARASSKLVEMAGGERIDEQDFREKRAVLQVNMPHATHTSLLFDPSVWRLTQQWWRAALPTSEQVHWSARREILLGPMLGLLGIFLLFPAVATMVAGTTGMHRVETEASHPPAFAATLVKWLISGAIAVFILRMVNPLRWLRIFSGDYLATSLFITGIVLLFWMRKTLQSAESKPTESRGLLPGVVLGMAAMLAFGAWMNWQLSDTWLNAARWLRFPVLVLACLPYMLAEEWALGALPNRRHAALSRIGRFVGLRLILWLTLALALLLLDSGQILLVLLVLYMAGFSLAVRLGADAVRRRTGSAFAAAVFGAILTAWFVAAVFPLT